MKIAQPSFLDFLQKEKMGAGRLLLSFLKGARLGSTDKEREGKPNRNTLLTA